jgi:hypothetical protein
MIIPNILSYFDQYKDGRGIPHVPNSDWRSFITQYSKRDIKDSLTEYIISNNLPFPSKEISYSEMIELFDRFTKTSMLDQYKYPDPTNVFERADYKYKYSDKPLGVIDKSHTYNSVSNYFQQLNRMKCGSNQCSSPWDIWHSRKLLDDMNWHFWRLGTLGKSDVCENTFRSAFRIGTYTATQFKPNVAKALYEKHNAKNVLDTSCGWGDRLAGFYATPCTEWYVGCDPNPEVFEMYKKQCIEYEKALGSNPVLVEDENFFSVTGVKSVEIWNLPSEDVNWSIYEDTFDFYFTSPPYFETERYASDHSSTQSWSRYPTFESWKNDFFFRVNKMIWETLKDSAYMMINIIEPRIAKGTRLNLCDDMVDDILTYPNAYYLGKIGMRMQARPHAIVNASKNSIFVEPIWVFRKNTDQYVNTDSLIKFEN